MKKLLYFVLCLFIFYGCMLNERVLTVTVEGRVPELPNCDDIAIIDPPGKMIRSEKQFTYEQGTRVRAFILGSTPPPPGTYWQSASFEYEGSQGNSFSIEMDMDKTINVILLQGLPHF